MDFKEFIIVVIYFAVSNGGPTSRSESCATRCQKNEKFNYVVGNTYIYAYTAQTETNVAGSSKDLTQLKVNAKVHITAVSACNMELKLRDISVVQSNSNNAKVLTPSKQANFKEELEAYPMMFAFVDGLVEHICPQSDDSAWSVNFKRGFLTTLQNTMKNLNRNEKTEEVDVSGQCLTDYVISKRGWSSIFITKTKDLDSCTKRSGTENIGIQFAPHFSNLAAKPLPVLKSEAKCDQVIDTESHILLSAKCMEIYVLRPFSNGAAGVVTTTKQEVNFVERKSAENYKTLPQTMRTSLLFDHQKETTKLDGHVEEVETTLQDMCVSQTITLHTPTFFRSLVIKMRRLEEAQLLSVYNHINRICPGNEILAKKFFLDALHMTVTPASAALIIRLIQSDHISNEMKDSWLLTSAFIPSPTKEFVMKFAVLLDDKKPRKNTLLGLSALIDTYCHQPSVECSKDEDLQTFSQKFANYLKTGCQGEKNTTEKILIALKAIGNVGFLTKAEEKLKSCYVNSKSDVAVRVAAIDALRRWPCDTQHKSLIRILNDYEEDVEVRLASYLSLMRCPSRETLESVRRMLETEQINQVGSFIWTHLLNLQKTNMPYKSQTKSIVQSFVLRQKFSTDALKFSRAYEKSFHSEAYQSGLHGQANLVFTPKSYLPRSLTTNLTVELFGRAINLIEIGGRMEGFEEWIESFFGPNGYFPERTVQDALKTMRGQRDVDDKHMEELHDQFKAQSEFPDPRASTYIRIFGNDIFFRQYQGQKNLEHILSRLMKDEETSITESFTFVDTSLIIPTQIGLPLNLTLNGTAIIQLLMKGHTHIRQIFNLDCDVNGYIKPSAAIQITGSMGVSTPHLTLGVQLDATLHTSTAISGKLVLKGGRLANVQIDAPEDRVDVININSQLYVIEGDDAPRATPEFSVSRVDFEGCSGTLTRTVFGLDICAAISYPNASEMTTAPGFPLTGPALFSIYVEKSDPLLTSYNFEYQWEDNKIGDQFIRTKRVYLDTPGASTDRQFLAELVLDEPGQTIKASLRTPFTKFGLQGKLVNEENEKRLDGTITVDDVEKIVLEAELRKEEYGDTQRYSPRFHLQLPYVTPIDLKGYLTIQNGMKIALDMSLENLTLRPITVIGDMNIANNLCNIDVTLKSFFITTNVKANVQSGEKHMTGNVNTEFSLLERWHRRYGLSFKYRDESSSSIRKLLASGEIQGSEFEPLAIAWELQRRKNYIENQLDFKANRKTFTTKQVFTYGKDSKNNEKYTATLIANCPSSNFDWTLAAVHQRNFGAMTSSIELYKGKTVVGKIQANAHAHLIPLMNLGAELSVQLSGYDVAAAATVKRLNANEYEGKMYIQLQPGEKAQINARYQDYSTSESRRHSIKIDATSPWSAKFLLESDLDTKNGGFSTNNVLNVNAKKYMLMVDYDPKSDEGHRLKTAALIAGKSYGGDASYRSTDDTTAIRINLKRFGYHPLSVKLELTLSDYDVIGDARIIWTPEEESGVRVEYNKRENGFRIGLKVDGIHGTHDTTFESSTEGSVTGSSISHESIANLVSNKKEYRAQFKIASTRQGGLIDSSVYARIGIVDRVYELEGNYKFDGNGWVGSVEFQKGQIKTFRGRTSGSVSRWDYPEFDFDLMLEMGSPEGEKYVFGINHVNTRERILSSVQLPSLWNYKPFNLSIQGLHQHNSNSVQYSGGASLDIANGDYYSIDGTWKGTNSDHFITTQVGKNKNYITLQFDTKFDNIDNIPRHAASFAFTSPFKHLENVRASIKNEREEAKFATSIRASWSPEDSMNADAIVSWQWDNEGQLRVVGELDTSFDEMRQLSVVVNHEWKGNKLKDSLSIERNFKDIAKFAFEGFFPSIRNVDVKIDVKLANLRAISSKFNYVILEQQLDASFDFVHDKEEIQGNLKIERGIETCFKLTSGVWLRNEKKYSLDFETKNENSKRLITLTATTPSGTYGPYQGEYSWANNGGVQELTLGFEYAPGRKLAIGASTDVGQYQGRMRMNIYTPFEGLRTISAGFTYDLLEPTRFGGTVEWDGGKKIEINSIGRLTPTISDIQIGAITSFSGYENVTIGLKYDFRPSNRKKTLMAFVSIKDQLLKMQGTVVCNNAGGELDVQIGTPYEEWKVVGGKVKMNTNRDGHSIRIHLRRNEKKIEGALMLRPLRVTARLRTPYENLRSTLIEWKMEKGENNLMSTFNLKKDSFLFDASAMYKQSSKEDFNVDANLKIPSMGIGLGLSGTAHLSDKRIEGTVELNHNSNKMRVTAQMLNEVKQKDLHLIFASPLHGFEEIKMSASYVNKDPFHHVASFNVEQSSKSVHLIARLTHENNAVLASLALTSDYALIPAFVVAAEQDYSTPTKSASFTLNLGEKHLKLRAESTTEYTLREGSLSFASNFGGVEKEFLGSYSYDLGRPQKVVTLQFAKDGRAIDVRGTYEFNTEQHPGSLVLSVVDGINGQYVYALNINHEMLKHVKVVDCIIHKGDWMSEFTVKWSVDDGVFDFTSELVVAGNAMSLHGQIGDTFIKLKGGHNDHVTELTGHITKENGGATFELISSSNIESFSGWSFTGGYNVHTKEKRVWLHANGDGKIAEITGSYVLENVKGKVQLKLKTTDDQVQRSWSSMLMAYFDLTTSQRNAGVNLQMNEDVFDAKLKWAPGRHKGIVKIEIATPIADYRSLGGELQYNLDRANTAVSSYVQWAGSKRVSVDFSVSIINVVGSLVINTPFPNTKTIEVRLEPSFNSERKNVQLSIKYGNQKEIRLNVDWFIDRQVGELQFKVDSTFADFKRFAVKYTYDTRNNTKMQLAISWPGENDNSKDLLAKYENAGYAMLDAEIIFGAFAKVFKTSQINFKYDLRADNKWGEFSIERGNEKVELRTYYTTGSLLRMILHTPHSDYKTISGEITFDRKEKSATVNAKWNEKNIEFLAVLKVNAYAGHLESSLQSNWEKIPGGKILFEYDLKASRPFVTAQFHHMENIVDFHLETGITVSEHYVLLFPLVQKDKSIIEVALNWNNVQTMQFIVEGRQGSVSIKLKTSFPPCENNYLEMGYALEPSLWSVKFSSAVCELETHVAGELHLQDKKWSVNSYWRSDFFAPGLVDGALDLDAPGDNGWLTVQWAHSTIEVKGRVNLQDRKMNTRLVLRNSFMENTIMIVGSYDASSPNHKYDFEMDLGDGDRVLVLGEVDTEDRKATGGSVRLMTPVEGMEDIYLKLKYVNNKSLLLGEFVLTWGLSEDQMLETKGLLTEKNFNFEMKTPLRVLRNLHVNSTVESKRRHLFEFETNINWNGKRLLYTLVNLEQDFPHVLRFSLKFYTPLTEDVSSTFAFTSNDKNDVSAFLFVKCPKVLIHLAAEYDQRRSFNATGKLEFGATKTTMLAKWHDGVVDVSADIISPMLDPDGMAIRGKGTYTDTTGNIELHAKCSESAHSIIADFNWQNSQFDGSASINCPLISKTQMTVKFHGTYLTDMMYTNVEVDSSHKFQLRLYKGVEKRMELLFDTSVTSLKVIEGSLTTFDNGFKALGFVKTVKDTYEMTLVTNKSSNYERHFSVSAKFGNHRMFLSWDLSPQLITGKFQLDSSSLQRSPLVINIQLQSRSPSEINVKWDINMKAKKLVDFSLLLSTRKCSIATTVDTDYFNIRNISLRASVYMNNGIKFVVTAGRLSNYHSFSFAWIRDRPEITMSLVAHENSKSEKNLSLAVVFSTRNSVDIQLSMASEGGRKDLDLLLHLFSTFDGGYAFDMKMETARTEVIEILGSVLCKGSKLELELQFLKNYRKHSFFLINLWIDPIFDLNFELGSPLLKPSVIQLKVHLDRTRKNENSIQGSLVIDQHSYAVSGLLQSTETSVGGHLSFTSSRYDPLRIIFEIEKNRKDGKINVALFLGDRKFEAKGSYHNPKTEKFDLDLLITTPLKEIKWIRVIANLSKSEIATGKLEITSSHKNMNGILIHGSLDLSHQRPKVKVSVRTPFAALPSVEADGSLMYNNDFSDILADLAVLTHDKAYTFHLKSKLTKHHESGFDVLVITTGVDVNDKKYGFQFNGKYSRGEAFGVLLEVIFASEKILSSKLDYEVDGLTKHLAVDVNIEERGRYFANVKVSPTIYRIDIVTPYKKMKKMYAEYTHVDHKSLRGYSFEISENDDRNWYVGVDHAVGQFKLEVETPLACLLAAHLSTSKSSDKTKMSFSYHGLRHIDAEVSKNGNSYKLKMTDPLQLDAVWITNTSANGTTTTIGEVTTDRNQRASTTSAFIYQQHGNGVKLSVQSREHFIVMTTSVDRTETGLRRSLNVTFDGQPLFKLNMTLENKYLHESEEKSIVLTLWYPDKEIYFLLKQEKGSNIWSSGIKMSFERGRVFGLILNVIPNGHFNLRLQLPEETLYFQLTQIQANRKNAYQLQAYFGFLNRPDLGIEFNLRWLNSNGQINAEFALVQQKAEMRANVNFVDGKNDLQLKLQIETKLQSKLNYTFISQMIYNKLKKTLEIDVKHPPHLGDLKLLANLKSTGDKDVLALNLIETDAQMNRNKLFEGSVEVHNKSLLFNYIYDNGKTVTASLSMPSFKSIEVDVSRGFPSNLMSDFNTTLTLNSSRFLIGNVNWRPGAISSAAKIFVSGYFDTKDKAIAVGSKLQETLFIALHHQKIEAMHILDSIKQRVANTWERETRGFNEDISNFATELKKLYDEDKFGTRTFAERIDHDYGTYVRSMCNFMLDTYSHFTYELRHGSEKMYEYFGDFGRGFLSRVDGFVLRVQSGTHDLLQDPDGTVRLVHKRLTGLLVQIVAHIKEKLADPLLLKATPHITYLIDRLGTKFQQMVITCTESLKEFVRASKKVPAIKQMMQFVADWIPDKGTLKLLDDHYHQIMSTYTEIFEKGTKVVESWTKHPAVVQLIDYASKLGNKLTWTYNYLEVEKHVTSVLETIVKRVKETCVELMQEVLSDLPHFYYHVPKVAIDADKGRMIFSQRLPFEWESFRQLPKFKLDEEDLKKLKDYTIEKAQELSFSDIWNNCWSKLSFQYGFGPKFEGRAFLAGQQHYMTFDGRYYEFAGSCSYILVSDFVDRKFTAVVNYVNNKKESITLQFGTTELKVSTADGILEVDGQKTEYPVQVGSVTAVRTRDFVTIRQGRNFELQCSIQSDVCFIGVDGFYHGKTGGLFGNFDKEESNDFLMSNRKRTKDTVEFARSWQLQNCQTGTNSAKINSDDGQFTPTICRDLLDDLNSPLQKCFTKVTPTPYFQMCKNDFLNTYTTNRNAATTILATYVAECNYNDAKVEIPADFVDCSISNSRQFTAQNAIRFSGNEEMQSADTVLLIEESNCNREKKIVEDLVKAIESGLSERNMQNNQYALVGFSGDGIHDLPHIHTVNGQVFGSWQDLTAQALPKLQLGKGSTDLLTSLRFVTDVPFRPGVRRNVVAFPCNSQISTNDLDLIHKQLNNQGIVLHVISNVNFKSDVIGCDKTQAYTSKAETRISCPEQFLQSVESKIALQSNGSVFSSSHLKSPKPRVSKRALDLLVNRIVEKSMPICQVCQCVGARKSSCKPCVEDVMFMDDTTLH